MDKPESNNNNWPEIVKNYFEFPTDLFEIFIFKFELF